MRAGKLRFRVNLQSKTGGQDGYGQHADTWTTYATTRADIKPMSGKELFHAQQVNAEVTHKVTIRYVAGVLPKHRIVHGARIFDINSVRNIDERKRLIVMQCREAVS